MGSHFVALDPLPLKRMLALDENGVELYPPELSQEEKPLALFQCVDFTQNVEKGSKKAKTGKESQAASVWPWQNVVESFKQAQEELLIIMDFFNHVESNDAVTVSHMTRPKLLPQEACSDVALRVSSKMRQFKDVSKYLKKNAKALERQVERESIFYGALMRLQRNWKIKRQRNVSGGPGGKAGFTMDLSFPVSVDSSLTTSQRTASLSTIQVDQDPNGLLIVHAPSGRSINNLQVFLSTQINDNEDLSQHSSLHQHSDDDADNEVMKDAVDIGARKANAVLRRIQASMFDELIFECLSREALPSSTTNLIAIADVSLHVAAGDAFSLLFKLLPSTQTQETSILKLHAMSALEANLRICLQQGFYTLLLGNGIKASKSPDGTGLLKQFTAAISHSLLTTKIVSLLENQVERIPHMWYQAHPTWQSCVAAWDIYFDIPQRTRYECRIVVRQESLSVEGIDALTLGGSEKENILIKRHTCTMSQLPTYLLSQVAGKIVGWIEEESVMLGCKVRRELLSIKFEDKNEKGHVSLVASPSSDGVDIEWWVRVIDESSNNRNGDVVECEKFLGAASVETLRGIVVDLVHMQTKTL